MHPQMEPGHMREYCFAQFSNISPRVREAVDIIVADGGCNFHLSVTTVQAKRCAAYLAAGRARQDGASTVDICMDDARFSAKDHCLVIVDASGIVVYPPRILYGSWPGWLTRAMILCPWQQSSALEKRSVSGGSK